MLENVPQQQPITYLPFHTKEFWDNFYKNRSPYNPNINWYFDITKVNIENFSLHNFAKEDEILVLGAGLSSILDYFDKNDYINITVFDFSEVLVKILNDKYKKDWAIDCYDILELNDSDSSDFNYIIDKGCLDCIISDPKHGQENFVKAVNNLMMLLNENGTLYYFSTSKDRLNLFDLGNKIKCKITEIDMNKGMGTQYKQFKPEDNLYYLYTVQKTDY